MNKKQFWENKIKGWEKKRYGKSDNDSSFKIFLNSVFGSSLQFRFKKAAEILSPHLSGKRLLDIGCGSGLFLEGLQETNLSHYTGIDWASGAIENAKQLSLAANWSEKTTFFAGDILESEYPPFDVAVALGVLDWLEKDQIDQLFKKIYPRNFLFSISEKVPSLTRMLHSLYVHLSYGWKTGGYVPRYYLMNEILEIARENGYQNVQVYRDKRLRFGAFLYQLD